MSRRVTSKRIRKWVTAVMIVTLIASLVGWLLQRHRTTGPIRIATGERGGLYYKVGKAIQDSLRERTGRETNVISTHGSQENYLQVSNGKAEFAIVQGGAVPIEKMSVVTPLFPELVFVIVRRNRSIEHISDLAGRRVALGPHGSGTRNSAEKILKHFDIDPSDLKGTEAYFTALVEDTSLDAAIVTAGVEHPDLRRVLETAGFDLLPVHIAPALDMVHPFLRSVQIPRGLFTARPPIPPEPIPTIATTAFLVSRPEEPYDVVQAALETIHEESLRLKVPTLIPRQEAARWISTRLHPTAQLYFHPSDHLGFMANVMESLAATKELLFAFGAGAYLLWIRWRRLKEKESQELVRRQKERLDRFLEETLRLEAAQMRTRDSAKLSDYLDQVTQIKLKALREFTEEELRGDQSFSILLDQCASLIAKLQLKMLSQNSDK